MHAFYVIKYPNNRVVLSRAAPKGEEELVDVINGKDWRDARKKLVIDGVERFEHKYGHGYFDE